MSKEQTFTLQGNLAAMRTLERKGKNWRGRGRLLEVEQIKWMMQAGSLIRFIKGAGHIVLDVRIFRRIAIKDDDNLRYSFNKAVIDPLKRKGAIIDDSMRYLTIRSIGQVKCPKEQECIEITVERD